LLRKLLIVPWFGPEPKWALNYRAQRHALAKDGYDLLFDTDEAAFRERVRWTLDVDCPPMSGNGKIHDYRPAFGLLYANELASYDFWGHTDMDCVYGRVTEFMPDERLAELDVYSDHWNYLCGPWAVYRNAELVNATFMDNPDWRTFLEESAASGWVETSFTDAINHAGHRVLYELNHGYQNADRLSLVDGRLCEDDHERSFFHFRATKQWPLLRAEAPCLA
jgi:hypothetical protein